MYECDSNSFTCFRSQQKLLEIQREERRGVWRGDSDEKEAVGRTDVYGERYTDRKREGMEERCEEVRRPEDGQMQEEEDM